MQSGRPRPRANGSTIVEKIQDASRMRRHAATVSRNAHRSRESLARVRGRAARECTAAVLVAKSAERKNAGKTAVFLSGIGDLRKK
jgi:hypothetical protein